MNVFVLKMFVTKIGKVSLRTKNHYKTFGNVKNSKILQNPVNRFSEHFDEHFINTYGIYTKTNQYILVKNFFC